MQPRQREARGLLRKIGDRVLLRLRLGRGCNRGVHGHARCLPQMVQGCQDKGRPGLQEPHAVPQGLGPGSVGWSWSKILTAVPTRNSEAIKRRRGRAWRCRRRNTLCFCADRALSTWARIGDGAAIPVAADVGRAPSPKVTPLPRERRDRRARQPFEEKRRAGLTAQDRRPPHGHATRSPRRAPIPNAPGGTSRRTQRPSARRRGRRAPVSPRCPSSRMRPLRGPRCRRRRGPTLWHFPRSSRPLDAAAMLRRTGAIGGNASRGFSGQMTGMRRRYRRPVNRDVRRPGALRRTRLGWRSNRSPGRSVARMPRSRHATIPEGVGRAGYERQKLGGGALASPPHKTL